MSRMNLRPRSVMAMAVLSMAVGPMSPVWGQSVGTYATLIIDGAPLPVGLGAGTVSSWFLLDISPKGRALFSVSLSGTVGGTADDSGAMVSGGGLATAFVAREGDAAPGGGLVGSISGGSVNGSGVAGIVMSLTGVPTTSDLGIFTSSGSGLAQVVREGQALNGSDLYSSFGVPFVAENGRIYQFCNLSGPSVTTANNSVFMTGSVGQSFLNTRAREGASAPGGGTYSDAFSFTFPSACGSDHIGFLNTVAGVTGARRLFVSDSFAVSLLATEGQAVSGSGALGASMTVGQANQLGQVSFAASLTGTSGGTSDDEGVYRASVSEGLVQIARKGQALPGGGTLTDVTSSAVTMNSGGRVMFQGTVVGLPGVSGSAGAIYAGSGGSLTRIAYEGQSYGTQGAYLDTVFLEAASPGGLAMVFVGLRSSTTTSFLGNAVALTDGVEFVEVLGSGDAYEGSAVSNFFGNGGKRRLTEEGRATLWVTLQDGRDALVQFTPSLRFRTNFSSTWDSAGNWTLSLKPSDVHDVRIDPATALTVTGPAGPVTVKSLTLGGGTGAGTLRLAGGTLSTVGSTTITNNGVLTGEGILNSSAVTVGSGGVIVAGNLVITGSVSNGGIIRGAVPGTSVYPTLSSSLTNTATGEVRVASGEYLNLTGAVVRNQGRIEVAGLPTTLTQLESGAPVTNVASSGLITVRSGILRFDGGLLNQGSLAAASGINEVYGDITNAVGGSINITGGAQANFYDDVVTNGTLRVAKSGTTTSVAVFMGSFSGAGAITGGGDVFFEGDLRPGNSPAFVNFDANVSFGPGVVTFMELGGLGDGEYDRITVSGVLALDGVLDVRFLAGLEPSGGTPVTYRLLQAGALVGDFDSILLPTLTGRDWFVQRTDTSLTIGSFTVIPEPGAVGMLAVGVGLVGMRRRR